MYSQPQLYDALQSYLRDKDAILSAVKSEVVEWKYANEEMYGLFPAFADIAFRGPNTWEPSKRRWLEKKPAGTWFLHGLDAAGNVRIIERSYGITAIFMTTDDGVDELVLGSRSTSLKRHIIEDGRVVGVYNYFLDPHQYSYETFEYENDRLTRSVEACWFVSGDEWVKASWLTTCTFEYDAQGLLKVNRDMGKALGGNKLVFARKKSAKARKGTIQRRPFVAFTIEIPAEVEDPEHFVYSNAYGLEMNIDDEWAVDTVILVPPALVRVVTGDTGVTSMGTVYAGASQMTSPDRFPEILDAGGKWVLLSGDDSRLTANFSAALHAGLNVILSTGQQLNTSIFGKKLPANLQSDRLVVAFKPDGKCSPTQAQKIAAGIRSELETIKCSDSRVILAASVDQPKVPDYMKKSDIDGFFLLDGDFGAALDVLIPLTLSD